MFFYLSFLRPPPIQAPLHGTISITPQISNDLRTEPFDSDQNIYYTWTLESSLGSKPELRSTIATKLTKLTTWRSSSAYKEMTVPVPLSVREGQKWRLALTCQAQGYGIDNPTYINLMESDVGSRPFPVVTMPISFSSKMPVGGSKREKQVMIERTYFLPFSTAAPAVQQHEQAKQVAFLKFTERTSYDLDKKIWDSGIGLSSWLCELKENTFPSKDSRQLAKLWSVLFSGRQLKVLELGAGIGMVSVVLAVLRSGMNLGSDASERDDAILTTDVATAMPLLEQNINENSQYYLSTSPRAFVLDWDEELPDEVTNVASLDIIMMADVSYNTSSFPALSRTISRLLRLGSNPPLILVGYKERDKAERTFWDITARDGIKFAKVGERKGAGGAPVEIWLG